MSELRILVTGSRDWEDRQAVSRGLVAAQIELAPLRFGQYDYNDGRWVIIHGHWPTGADAMADDFALASMYKVERHPALWEKYGKQAGFIRNAEMVKAGADICIAFIRNNSKGATHTAELAQKAGIKTVIYRA